MNTPPSLSIKGVQQEWSDGELCRIVKNGLKMTGMPAFGPTHDEEELRAMVAFVRTLPDLQPEEFKELVEAGRHSRAGEHHHHETQENKDSLEQPEAGHQQ